MDQVRVESSAAGDLLNLIAFLAPDDIPYELLRQGADLLPEPLSAAVADELAWDDALAALQRYSLVEVNTEADSLSVHRLVQAVVRDRLGENKNKIWAKTAIGLVNAFFPNDIEVEEWSLCALLLPHALAALECAGELNLETVGVSRLWNQTGFYLKIRAEFVQALACHEQALKITEAVYGPGHTIVAVIVNNVGSVLQELGDLAAAKACYERALRIDEAAYGPDHPNVAIRVGNLGSVLYKQKDLMGAKECYERAVRIDEAVYGPYHPHVASPINNLGNVLKDLNDLVGAKAYFERALRIDEAAYGPEHPKVAILVNNLGMVFRAQGDLSGAKECYERALNIFTRFLGPDHPNTQTVRENLESLRGKSGLLSFLLKKFRFKPRR